MKKSEELNRQAAQEDNDFRAMALKTKAIREQRDERFKESILPQLKYNYEVYYDAASAKYTIDETPFGIVDYFPKANKVLIRKENRWYDSGLKWIRKNLM